MGERHSKGPGKGRGHGGKVRNSPLGGGGVEESMRKGILKKINKYIKRCVWGGVADVKEVV